MVSALEVFMNLPFASPEHPESQAVPAGAASDAAAALQNESDHAYGQSVSSCGAASNRLPSSGILADALSSHGLAPRLPAVQTATQPDEAGPSTVEARLERRNVTASDGPVAGGAAGASSSGASGDADALSSLINGFSRGIVEVICRDDRSLKRTGKQRAAKPASQASGSHAVTGITKQRKAGAAGGSSHARARTGCRKHPHAPGGSGGDAGAGSGEETEDEIEEIEEETLDGPEWDAAGQAYEVDSWPTLTSDPCDPEAGPLTLGPRPQPVTPRVGAVSGKPSVGSVSGKPSVGSVSGQPSVGSVPGQPAESIYGDTAEVPASINRHLRPYQREGVQFFWRQYKDNQGGVLGDEMGLGKTVQTIAFLSAVLGKTAGPSDTLRRFPLSPTDCKQALLVVPVSTLGNWRRELRTWGCFRVALGHGKEFAASIAQVQAREVEILLTTYGMVRDHGKDIQAHPWEVTVWDEAHTIKNPRTRLSKAADAVACTRRFCMTGTPMSNDHTELWALFNFVSSDRVGEKKDFKKFYGDVLKRGMRHNATQHQLRQRVKRQITLQALIQKWMLQRFKTIIAHQMPKKIDQIILCKLAPAQEEAYAAAITSPDFQAILRKDEKPCYLCGNPESSFQECCKIDLNGPIAQYMHDDNEECLKCPSCLSLSALSYLLKIANHLELVKPDPSSSLPQHKRDAQAAFARTVLGPDAGPRDKSFIKQSSTLKCGKMRALHALLETWKLRKAKVLLFSYSTQMLDILEDFVASQNYKRLRLDGSTPSTKRTELVDEFNAEESNIFVFLLSTKAGGLGLNLVAATVVVIFDPNWNPAHDMQAQDRAYRIGQRHDVTVYRLISSNTIEENMYLRQVYKRAQERVALQQSDEVRYFDAVQGDRRQQGELFGMTNLLRYHERSDRSYTREMLRRADGQRGATEPVLPEESEQGFVIMRDGAREAPVEKKKAGGGAGDGKQGDGAAVEGAEGAGADSDDDRDGRISEEKVEEAGQGQPSGDWGEEDFGGLAEILGDELHDIALHVHRDADVLGRRGKAVTPKPPSKRAKSGPTPDTAATGPGAPSLNMPSPASTSAPNPGAGEATALDATRPSAGAGEAAAGAPRAGRKSARKAEQDEARKAAQSRVGEFACSEDFMQAVSQQADLAGFVERYVDQGRGKVLEDAVYTLPSRPMHDIVELSDDDN